MEWNSDTLTTLREQTPGCRNVIHFNNAGASLMPQPVLESIIEHLRLEAERGGYEAKALRLEVIEKTYHAIAKMIHACPEEIAIIENATRAWDMAVYGFPFEPGDTILTHDSEYASNYIALLQLRQKKGVNIQLVSNDEHGQISLKALEAQIDGRTKAIVLTHMPTNDGLVNPAEAVGEIAQSRGLLYILDICQSTGQYPIDVRKIQCDIAAATGRKFLRGPRGTGFLYVRNSVIPKIEPPFLDLHAAKWVDKDRYEIEPTAKRFENWETNYSTKIGLGVAVDYANAIGLDRIWQRVQRLGAELRNKLSGIKNVTVHDRGELKGAIVTFSLSHLEAEKVEKRLRSQNINVSISKAEYARLNIGQKKVPAVVRASLHYYNTLNEIERFCNAIEKL